MSASSLPFVVGANTVEDQRARWERKRSRTAKELLETEHKYLEQLDLVLTYFVTILKAKGTLKPAVLETIFGPLESLYSASHLLSLHLEKGNLGPGLENFCQSLDLYGHYAENLEQANKTLKEQVRKNKSFQRFKKLQETRPQFQGRKLEDLLPLPLQRLHQYKHFFRDLLENTSPDTAEYQKLTKTVKSVCEVSHWVQDIFDKRENSLQLLRVQKLLKGQKTQVLTSARTQLWYCRGYPGTVLQLERSVKDTVCEGLYCKNLQHNRLNLMPYDIDVPLRISDQLFQLILLVLPGERELIQVYSTYTEQKHVVEVPGHTWGSVAYPGIFFLPFFHNNFLELVHLGILDMDLYCRTSSPVWVRLYAWRWYIREGWLLVVPAKGEELKRRMFFLFSDILIAAKPCHPLHLLNSNKLSCQAVYPLHQCSVDKVFGHTWSQGGLLSLSFPHKTLLLMSCSQQEINDWYRSLTAAVRQLKA